MRGDERRSELRYEASQKQESGKANGQTDGQSLDESKVEGCVRAGCKTPAGKEASLQATFLNDEGPEMAAQTNPQSNQQVCSRTPVKMQRKEHQKA